MQRVRHRINRTAKPARHVPVLPVALAFFLGAAAVTLCLGLGISVVDWSFLKTDGGSLTAVFFSCAIYNIAVCLAATSTLGAALIPACAFLCGGSVAYRSVAVISSAGASAVLQVVMTVIIPAIFIVPPFFVISCGGIRLSGLLRAGGEQRFRVSAARRFSAQAALSFMMAFAAAAYMYYIHPA